MAKSPKRHHESWSKAELATLKKMTPKNTAGAVAMTLERSVSAIRQMATRIGAPFGLPKKTTVKKAATKKTAKSAATANRQLRKR